MQRCRDPCNHHYLGNKSPTKAPQNTSLHIIQTQVTLYHYSVFMKIPPHWNNATGTLL